MRAVMPTLGNLNSGCDVRFNGWDAADPVLFSFVYRCWQMQDRQDSMQ